MRADNIEFNTIHDSKIKHEAQARGIICMNDKLNTPSDLQDIIRDMMSTSPSNRPSASELLRRRPLLSEEEKKLNKVKEAYQTLAKKQMILSKFSPPRRKLVRASTWDAMASKSMG